MIFSATNGVKGGKIFAPSSKSVLHRLLIAAALGKETVEITYRGMCDDIIATADCLSALGAEIKKDQNKISVTPIKSIPSEQCHLYCKESGSTLRFMLPIAAALGANAVFHMEGRLPERPLYPLDGVLERHGAKLEKKGNILYLSGKLNYGDFEIAGNISSQYITGLLFALPLLSGDSRLVITGKRESVGYIDITEQVMTDAKIDYEKNDTGYIISGNQKYGLKKQILAEGDYSSAAFFLCLGALSENGVTVVGLSENSRQGDRKVLEVLSKFGADVTKCDGGYTVRKNKINSISVDSADIPDLVPVLAVTAAFGSGKTVFYNASRLKLKESDRILSTVDLLNSFGVKTEHTEESITVYGTFPTSVLAKVVADHRIVMSAAVLAAAAHCETEIGQENSVLKSYPEFWRDIRSLL